MENLTTILTVLLSLTASCLCQNNCTISGEFQCNNGLCISHRWVCDGDPDCPDGEDEMDPEDCPPCNPFYEFRCGDGQCIFSFFKCDLKFDCRDGSDEKAADCPPCPNGYFSCASGGCVEDWLICDRENNCMDFSDESEEACPCFEGELRCPSSVGPPDWFPGPCVPVEHICDPDNICDCPNCADEANCTLSSQN